MGGVRGRRAGRRHGGFGLRVFQGQHRPGRPVRWPLGRRPGHGPAGRHPIAGRTARGRGRLYLAARQRGARHAVLARPHGHGNARPGHHRPGWPRIAGTPARRAYACRRPAMTRPLLQVRGLRVAFGGIIAVDDVSFDLHAGRMLALIGPNGAGKSTCFNVISGQLRPDAGSVRLDGAELVGLPPQRIWRRGVGRTFQTAATFASLTVRENVQAALLSRDGLLYRAWRRAASHAVDEADALLEQVGMLAHAQRPCGVLAYGDVKRVELAVALAHRPRLLLMDEPTAGMAVRE